MFDLEEEKELGPALHLEEGDRESSVIAIKGKVLSVETEARGLRMTFGRARCLRFAPGAEKPMTSGFRGLTLLVSKKFNVAVGQTVIARVRLKNEFTNFVGEPMMVNDEIKSAPRSYRVLSIATYTSDGPAH